ncbi:MAG: hypothetical protein ABJB66_09155 [Gemmatimonadaceae bacterium]
MADEATVSYKSKFQRVTALALPALVLACSDSSGTAPIDDGGTFSGQASGGELRAFSGRAFYSDDVDGDEYGFAITLDGTDVSQKSQSIVVYRPIGSKPPVGAYAIVTGAPSQFEVNVGIVLDADSADPLLCVPVSGKLNITSVGTERYAGTYRMQASCSHANGDAIANSVSLTGAFDASLQIIASANLRARLPVRGRYNLTVANDRALPATLYEDTLSNDNAESFILSEAATDGSFTIDANGHYEHRLNQDAFIDGVLVAHYRYSDRGQCTRVTKQLRCESNYLQNVAFSGDISGQTITITQDIEKIGHWAAYRYFWSN